MSVLVDKVKSINMDRSRWKLVKFGDVAIKQKKAVDREKTHLKHYVRGEHMSSEDLHLQKWGELEDEYLGPAFIRYFEKGDILYGSRRTYLRKVAIAPFEGITSNTTFVIKANEKIIHKRLLPFVMLSEEFSQHSIKNSKGSVNPYINWKDLANYQFLLPPKEQQAEIAELLWAIDEVIQCNRRLVSRTRIAQSAAFSSSLDDVISETVTIKDIASADKYSCVGGPFGSNLSGKHYVEEPGVPVIRGTNLTINGTPFVENGFVYVSLEKAEKLSRNMAYRGDIIVTQRGTLGQVGLIPSDSNFDRYVVSQSQMKLKVDQEKAIPEYVYYYLNSPEAQRAIDVATISTGIPHINLGIFKNFKIELPALKDQVDIVKKIVTFVSTIKQQDKLSSDTESLKKSLINRVF